MVTGLLKPCVSQTHSVFVPGSLIPLRQFGALALPHVDDNTRELKGVLFQGTRRPSLSQVHKRSLPLQTTNEGVAEARLRGAATRNQLWRKCSSSLSIICTRRSWLRRHYVPLFPTPCSETLQHMGHLWGANLVWLRCWRERQATTGTAWAWFLPLSCEQDMTADSKKGPPTCFMLLSFRMMRDVEHGENRTNKCNGARQRCEGT